MNKQPCAKSCECPGFEDLLVIVLFPLGAYSFPWGSTLWEAILAGALKATLCIAAFVVVILVLTHPDQCGCKVCGADSCDPQP